jgi:hypothetical protein
MYTLYALGISSPIVILPVALAVTIGAVFVFNKVDARRKNLPEVMPTVAEVERGTSRSQLDRSSTGLFGGTAMDFDIVNRISVTAVIITVGYLGAVLAFAMFGA